MRVLACIVTKREPGVFLETMNRVLQSCPDCEFLVINNGRSPADFPPDRFAGGRVAVYHIPVNVGHPCAVNFALHHVFSRDYEFFLLMDDDVTFLTDSWYSRCLALMALDPRIGVVGGKMLNPDGQTVQLACIQALPKVLTAHPGEPRHTKELDRTSRVIVVPSSFSFYRVEHMRRVGWFDILFTPGQFVDVDYCFRMWLAGFSCVYDGGIEVLHRQLFAQDDPRRALDVSVHYYAMEQKYKGFIRFAQTLEQQIEKMGREIIFPQATAAPPSAL